MLRFTPHASRSLLRALTVSQSDGNRASDVQSDGNRASESMLVIVRAWLHEMSGEQVWLLSDAALQCMVVQSPATLFANR
jgi:hypothetical protein